MTPTRTQPPSRKRWLHFCESGSDIQEAPALASATEAVFTRILPQQGFDCIWSAGRGHSGFVRRAFLSLVMTPRCYCWANGASLPEKDLKRATATEILIWTICVFLPSTKPWLWGVGGSWRRVTVRLKEKHPGILCCYGLLKLTGFGGHWRYTPFHQIQRDLDNSMYKLSLKCPQEVTTFTMKKKSLKIWSLGS